MRGLGRLRVGLVVRRRRRVRDRELLLVTGVGVGRLLRRRVRVAGDHLRQDRRRHLRAEHREKQSHGADDHELHRPRLFLHLLFRRVLVIARSVARHLVFRRHQLLLRRKSLGRLVQVPCHGNTESKLIMEQRVSVQSLRADASENWRYEGQVTVGRRFSDAQGRRAAPAGGRVEGEARYANVSIAPAPAPAPSRTRGMSGRASSAADANAATRVMGCGEDEPNAPRSS